MAVSFHAHDWLCHRAKRSSMALLLTYVSAFSVCSPLWAQTTEPSIAQQIPLDWQFHNAQNQTSPMPLTDELMSDTFGLSTPPPFLPQPSPGLPQPSAVLPQPSPASLQPLAAPAIELQPTAVSMAGPGPIELDFQSRHCNECQDVFSVRQSPFQAGGWVQGGVTLNPDDPNDGLNGPVLFNDQANEFQLNQFYLYFGKQARANGESWDWGARLDVNYGTDSRFVTATGLERDSDRTRRWNSENSDYGIAIPQAYVDIATPYGPYGSTIRVGHFYSLAGYETFTAPDNFFYSHSYNFLYGQPFTDSGVMWMGKLSPTLAMTVSGTTGWDAFFNDSDQWGGRVGFLKQFNNRKTSLGLTGHFGNDQTVVADDYDSRVWANLVLRHSVSDKLQYILQGDYGFQKKAVAVLDNVNATIGFDDGTWWGINQQFVYQVNSQWSTGLRLEWFRDDGNSRIGTPVDYATGGPVFNGGDYVALTAGVNYKPQTNVLLRSEMRFDNSDVESNPAVPAGIAGIRPFDDKTDENQLTIGFDAILMF